MQTIDLNLHQHKTHKQTHHIPCFKILSLRRLCNWAWSQCLLCHCCLSLSLSLSLLPVTEECLLCWWILSLLYCFCSPRSDKRHTPSPSFTHWVMRMDLSPPYTEMIQSLRLFVWTHYTHLGNCPSEVD